MSRQDFLLKRVGFAVATILVAITVNFLLFRAVSGDAVDALRCTQCGQEFREHQRDSLGLDEPLITQYWMYVSGLFQGDLGTSLRTEQPVTSEMWTPLTRTVPMVSLGLAVAFALGIATGVIASWRRDTAVDRVSTWGALVFNSLPAQWLGLIMVLFVASAVGLPASGIEDPTLGILEEPSTWVVIGDRLEHMVLPALTLALVIYGNYAFIVRSAMLETLGEDYVLTARAKGMSNWAVVWRHGLRNALLPLVTMGALSLGFVMGGSITIEYVFSYPGIGLRTVEAINQRDWPVLQGIFLLITVTVIVANLIADLLYSALDPRVTTS